jgi:hypothetical protein
VDYHGDNGYSSYLDVVENEKKELQLQMKKISALIMLIATAILSGVALNKFLNWAGQQEDIFDFDLDEDIDNEQL